MAWQDEMVSTLRVLINDIDSVTYDDERLEQTLCAAARLVLQERLNFSQDFEASVFDLTISPDPTSPSTEDLSFVNLVVLRAACIVGTGEAMQAANQAISVRDGSSAIDLRGKLEGKMKLLEKGWCAVYQDAKFEKQMGAVPVAGAAVLTPFRTFLHGTPGYHARERYFGV